MNRWLVVGVVVLSLLSLLGCSQKSNPLPTRPPVITCPGGVIGDTTKSPTIELVDFKIGDHQVSGTANNINTNRTGIAVWCFTNTWQLQPGFSGDGVVCSDHTWEFHIGPWNRVMVVLYSPEYRQFIPEDSTTTLSPEKAVGVLAWTSYPPKELGPALVFDDRIWQIRSGASMLDGQAVQWWADPAAVFVDNLGLHLRLNQVGGLPMSAGVVLNDVLGYGTYTVQVNSQVWNLEPGTDIKFGCLDPASKFAVEFAGENIIPGINEGQFVGYYRDSTSTSISTVGFMLPTTSSSTWQLDWRSYQLEFLGWWGLEPYAVNRIIENDVFYYVSGGKKILPEGDHFSFNIIGQPSANPAKASELIIRSFTFEP